jgi:2-polyprenyl-6-methoxyphenol hydroxylase-like FAD-dependent oxidoreductase
MGASLAIYGAKALVHFIGQSPDDVDGALERFNQLMQPVIFKFQQNARKNARTFLPASNRSLELNNIIFKYVPNYFISKKMSGELTLTDRQKNFLL